MAKKDKIHSTTQDFTEIVDIIDDVVLFKGKNACSVLEVSSVNFFLLSADEQNARIYGYMSLINSLSFAIQILIVSKRVDMGTYLKVLDQKIEVSQNNKLKEHLAMYRQFIDELVKNEGLLDKKIYVIVPYSYLEGGLNAGTMPQSTNPKQATNPKAGTFADQAKNALLSKRSVINAQIERMGLMARPLPHEELIKLFYEMLNNDSITVDFNSQDIKNVII
jgi:hypothetical protein